MSLQHRLTRLGLAVLAVQSAVLGAWATASPRHFYDTFPGGGHQWVSVDGPYNEHLMRDFGGLQLALAVIGAVAAWKLTLVVVRAASVAFLAFGIPHLLYHATNTEPLPTTGDKVSSLGGLTVAVVVPALVLLGTWWPAGHPADQPGAVSSPPRGR